MKNNSKNKVLGDHKKVGKKLLPPLLHGLGNISPTHYDRDTLPELVWLALIENMHGLQIAAGIAGKIGQYVQDSKSNCRFIDLSEMHDVTESEWNNLRAYLETHRSLGIFLSAIQDFVVLYPECPLISLFEKPPTTLINSNFLDSFEKLFKELTYKRGRQAVLMQANAIYLLGCQGKLFMAPGMSLGNFEELKNYPNTDESKKVGASVCSASGMLLNMKSTDETSKWSWPDYFWKRNLDLKPITFHHIKSSNE